ncbi:MAG: GNAT family N-acetyltransferase [Acidobacteriota bacterium]|jgi:GNAT superfamily N-acetyltransferase
MRTDPLEQIEIDAWSDFYRAAPAGLRSALGIEVATAEPVPAFLVPGVDVLALNRVLGLDPAGAVPPRLFETLIRRYRSAGVGRFFVQAPPEAATNGLGRALEASGLRPYNHWMKLSRNTETLPGPRADLEIREIGLERAEDFGAIVVAAFGWPEALADWIAAVVGRPAWRHYLAYAPTCDGPKPVATGALYARGSLAWLDFAATLPGHRGRGAQTALLARRIRDAHAIGCRRLVLETGEDLPEHPMPSYRNARAAGFEIAYRRPNYLGRSDPR